MSRRVLVTGATGVIGRATVPRLTDAGWSVSGVARAGAAAAWLESIGARPVAVDLFDPAAAADAVAGHGAVVHLATSVPALAKMGRRRAWATNDRLRVDATRNLIAGARRHGIDRFVKESITFPYADGADGWLDEDAPVDPAVAWRATLEGERSVRELGAEGAAAVVAALGAPPGTYNVVDDRPVTRREYANARLRAATGWAPRWPDARAGWEAIGAAVAVVGRSG